MTNAGFSLTANIASASELVARATLLPPTEQKAVEDDPLKRPEDRDNANHSLVGLYFPSPSRVSTYRRARFSLLVHTETFGAGSSLPYIQRAGPALSAERQHF